MHVESIGRPNMYKNNDGKKARKAISYVPPRNTASLNPSGGTICSSTGLHATSENVDLQSVGYNKYSKMTVDVL